MTDAITNLRLHALAVTHKTVWTFVEVETSEGLVGTGEATLSGQEDALSACFERWRPELLGRPASVASLSGSWPKPDDLAQTAVAYALDQALWDIDGQRAGKSVAALLTTEGFRDILEIGRHFRPDMYDWQQDRPVPVIPRERRFCVAERVASDGRVLKEPVPEDVDRLIEGLTSVQEIFGPA